MQLYLTSYDSKTQYVCKLTPEHNINFDSGRIGVGLLITVPWYSTVPDTLRDRYLIENSILEKNGALKVNPIKIEKS